MAKVKQITAWVDSTPGQLGRLAKALGDAKVNITAFAAYGTGESPIRFQVSSPLKARKALEGLGVRITEEEVVRVTVSDKPGKLGEIGRRLGDAGINVEYAYASLGKGARKADVVLGVSDVAGALKVLRGV